MKKLLSIFLLMCLTVNIIPVFADDAFVTVRITVDNIELISPTNVDTDVFDLKGYGLSESPAEFTALHAIIKALILNDLDPTDPDVLTLGAGGTYITKVCGISASGFGGFMFAVNNTSGYLSINQQTLQGNDTLVLYYVEDFINDIYTYFDKTDITAEGSEDIELNLSGLIFDPTIGDWGDFAQAPIADAFILINGEPTSYKTDENGYVSFSIPTMGSYIITAAKYLDDKNILKASYCSIIITSDSEDSNNEDAPPSLSNILIETKSYLYELKNSTGIKEGTLFKYENNTVGNTGFSPDTRNYITYVNYYVKNIFVKAVSLNSDTDIYINDNEATSGSAFEVALSYDSENIIRIRTENSDGINEYTIKVIILPDISLKGIKVNGEDISFQPGRTDINVFVPENSDSIDLTLNATEGSNIYIGADFDGNSEEFTGGIALIGGETTTVDISDYNPITVYIAKQEEELIITKYVLNIIKKYLYSPDYVFDFLPAPGQFTNQENYGVHCDLTLSGEINNDYITNIISLGAFGGYIVYKFNNPILNDINNPYGVDFIVYGNAYAGNTEPAGVMVAEDKDNDGLPDKWYSLAGSEHYEDETIWNYSVTYNNTGSDFNTPKEIPYTDNLGNSKKINSLVYYPDPEIYKSSNPNSITLSGTLIQRSNPPFGYADTHANNTAPYDIAANPYIESGSRGDGFDISWAVDENGLPVNLSNVSFIKVYTCVLSEAGSLGEISSEVGGVARVREPLNELDLSENINSITINGSNSIVELNSFENQVFNVEVEDYEITVKVNAPHENIFINNKRVKSGQNSEKIRVFGEKEKIIRIIAQDQNKAPKIYYLKIKGPQINKDILISKLNEAKALNENEYTEKSYEVLYDAICHAEEILALPEQTNKDYEDAYILLFDAIKGLKIKSSGGSGSNTITVKVSVKGNKTILSSYSVTLEKNSTAFDAIEKALIEKDIDFEVTGAGGSKYISGIDGLYEFDNGEYSGWLYRVNSKLAEVGMTSYILKDRDSISVYYTNDWTKEADTVGSGYSDVKNNEKTVLNENKNAPIEAKSAFSDVSDEDAKYINYLASRKIILGKSKDKFAPEDNITRAEFITILSRILNEDLSKYNKLSFNDINQENWYYNAACWAYENKIILGYNNMFYPDDFIKREDMAVMLFRFINRKLKTLVPEYAIGNNFEDYELVSSYAKSAVTLLKLNKYIEGSKFMPKENAKRAEVANLIGKILIDLEI